MSSKYDLDKLIDPFGLIKAQRKMHESFAAIADPLRAAKISPKLNAMFNTAKMHESFAAIADPLRAAKINPELNAMFNTAKMHESFAAIADPLRAAKINPELNAMFNTAKMHESFAAIADPLRAITVQADSSSLIASFKNHKKLGIHTDIERFIAATTLIPGLKDKISYLNQKILRTAEIEPIHNSNENISIQEYLDALNIENKNKINIDSTTIHTLDIALHDQEIKDLTAELSNIGIFNNLKVSIFSNYFQNLDQNKVLNTLKLIFFALLFLGEPIVEKYEPVQNFQKKAGNFLNGITGVARMVEDCHIMDKPNGIKKISIERENIVNVYKNDEDTVDGWSKVKFNKDNHDIIGYVKRSQIALLE